MSAAMRLIMRVEFSPSKGGFYEVLQCGHLGQKRNKKYPLWRETTRNGRKTVIAGRNCKECAK
jgi:hypothetical protein